MFQDQRPDQLLSPNSSLSAEKPKPSVGCQGADQQAQGVNTCFNVSETVENISTSRASPNLPFKSFHPLTQDLRLFLHGAIPTPSCSTILFFSHPF